MSKSDLTDHVNIGKDTESKLINVGIDSFSKLKEIGSEQAFLRLQSIDPGACLDLLYGMEGAIMDVKWFKLPKDKKLQLLEFHKMSNKK